MIRLLVALPAEARALVRRFGLTRSGAAGLPVWRGDGVSLVVAGVGAAAAARGVEALAGLGAPRETAWVNVGVAGHRERSLGEVVMAHKVVEAASGRAWYPPLVFEPPCATATVTTVTRPERDYPDDAAYEMEAAGFCEAAARHASAELIQVVKVISDNPGAPLETVTAAGVERLIEGAVETIAGIAGQTAELAHALDGRRAAPRELDGYLGRWRFTVTQRRQLEELLRRLATLEAAAPGAWDLAPGEPGDGDLAPAGPGGPRSGRAVLALLEARLAAHLPGVG